MIKVATDAGGTFTDLVAFEETSGQIYVGKALTTPKDPSKASFIQLRKVARPGSPPTRYLFSFTAGRP
jgi:N-methylhydantoinase A